MVWHLQEGAAANTQKLLFANDGKVAVINIEMVKMADSILKSSPVMRSCSADEYCDETWRWKLQECFAVDCNNDAAAAILQK